MLLNPAPAPTPTIYHDQCMSSSLPVKSVAHDENIFFSMTFTSEGAFFSSSAQPPAAQSFSAPCPFATPPVLENVASFPRLGSIFLPRICPKIRSHLYFSRAWSRANKYASRSKFNSDQNN